MTYRSDERLDILGVVYFKCLRIRVTNIDGGTEWEDNEGKHPIVFLSKPFKKVK